MDQVYCNIAKSIIGQCEVGNVNCLVLVQNTGEAQKVIDAIAYLQYPMKFEGFKRGLTLTLFGKTVKFVVNKPGSLNKARLDNLRIYELK